MKPTRFDSKTTPWRVIVPAAYSPDGKRKAKYFETKDEAKKFCDSLRVDGRSALGLIPKFQEDRLRTAVEHVLEELGPDPAALYRAVDYYKKTHANIKPATVTEAAEAFQAWRARFL